MDIKGWVGRAWRPAGWALAAVALLILVIWWSTPKPLPQGKYAGIGMAGSSSWVDGRFSISIPNIDAPGRWQQTAHSSARTVWMIGGEVVSSQEWADVVFADSPPDGTFAMTIGEGGEILVIVLPTVAEPGAEPRRVE